MTKRIYYTNPYKTTLVSKIISQGSDEQGIYLILDKTIFYPEGGGQPADHGYINQSKVIDVREIANEIRHYVDKYPIKDTVKLNIDWDRRFDHMQQHGGQHIFSGIAYKLFKAQTVGFHLGEEITTIDLSDGSLTDLQVQKIEDEANEFIRENKYIIGFFPSEKELSKLKLRKQLHDVGELRVIRIEDLDFSPCGGTHPSYTSEVGIIKVIKKEKIRGNTRLHIVAGTRAYSDYVKKHDVISNLVEQFSTPFLDLPDTVQHLHASIKEQNKNMNILKDKLALLNANDHLEIVNGINQYIYYDSELSPSQIRSIANEFSNKKNSVGAILSGTHKLNLILFKSEELNIDLVEIFNKVKEMYDCQGGGNGSILQGGCKNCEPNDLINKLKKLINS